jgi:redox-sensitive bicupin YhaK (pirin superfamily)
MEQYMSKTNLPFTFQALRVEPGRIGDNFSAAGLRGQLDPFISVDHFLMTQPTFAPHPHAGFNVLTYMLPHSPGGFINRASFDREVSIDPGDLHWTVAGSGMVHEEVPAVRGTVCDGLQIFINLAGSHKFIAPASLHQRAADTATIEHPGATVRVVLGQVNIDGQVAASRLEPPTAVRMLDLSLQAGAALDVPLPASHNAFALVVDGTLHFGPAPTAYRAQGPDAGVTFGHAAQARVLHLQAETASHVLLFSGEPIGEPVVAQGPFVMNTPEQIHAAMAAYRSGRMGSLAPYYGA